MPILKPKECKFELPVDILLSNDAVNEYIQLQWKSKVHNLKRIYLPLVTDLFQSNLVWQITCDFLISCVLCGFASSAKVEAIWMVRRQLAHSHQVS